MIIHHHLSGPSPRRTFKKCYKHYYIIRNHGHDHFCTYDPILKEIHYVGHKSLGPILKEVHYVGPKSLGPNLKEIHYVGSKS